MKESTHRCKRMMHFRLCLWVSSLYVRVRPPVESSITTTHREWSSRKWKEEKRIPRSKRWERLKERVRAEGESQVGNWWCNCWLLVSSYLGFSGLLSGHAHFPISVSLLEWAKPGNPYAFFYFPLVCLTLLLSLFSLSTVPSSHWPFFYLSLSFRPSPQTDVMQRAVGWKEQQGKGRVQPAGGQRWVCSRIGLGEGLNTLSLSFSPPPRPMSPTSTSTKGLLCLQLLIQLGLEQTLVLN